MTEDRKPETPSKAEASAKFEPEAKPSAPEDQEDIRRVLAASDAAGNENTRGMLDEGDDWRELPFIRSEAGKAVVQWPPLGITSSQEGLDPEVQCVVGRYCAMELVGHTKRYANQFGSEYLSDVVREIVRHGEWTQLEIGFFEALSNFIAWGYIRVSGDFQAFPCDAGPAAGRTARDRNDRRE